MNNMNKVCYLFLSMFLLGAIPFAIAQDQPNIVLIMCDYMGYADTEPFGSKEIKTPAISQLAEKGIKYTNFYVAAPVCSPSRAALLTGLYPIRTGIEANVSGSQTGLTKEFPSIASKLKDNGYTTALVGKWHLGFKKKRSWPNTNGFDYFFGFSDWSIDYYSHKTYYDCGIYENDQLVETEGYITDVFTDTALSFINTNQSKPFFLCLFYNATLPPLQIPGNPSDVRDKQTWMNSNRQDYIKVVENLDYNIGRILTDLKNADLNNNTIVVFTYDHGGRDLVDHGEFFHGFATLWEGGIRAPLIIYNPFVVKPSMIDSRLAINMDITATLLTAASVSIDDLDGVDLMSNEIDPERILYWRFPGSGQNIERQYAIRKGKWKLIYDNSSKLLFNIEEDPGERKDLGYKYPYVKGNLITDLEFWRDEFEN